MKITRVINHPTLANGLYPSAHVDKVNRRLRGERPTSYTLGDDTRKRMSYAQQVRRLREQVKNKGWSKTRVAEYVEQRMKDPDNTASSKPWLRLGISQRTWYRRYYRRSK